MHQELPGRSLTPVELSTSEPVGWGWRACLLLLWLVAGFGAMYFARDLEGYQFMGWPLGYWLASQGIIVFYVVLVALYAWGANRLERARRPAPRHPAEPVEYDHAA